jgi:hypothetical protein
MGRSRQVLAEIFCANLACGVIFIPERSWQRYCCPECRKFRLSERRLDLLEAIYLAACGHNSISVTEAVRELKMVDGQYRRPKGICPGGIDTKLL